MKCLQHGQYIFSQFGSLNRDASQFTFVGHIVNVMLSVLCQIPQQKRSRQRYPRHIGFVHGYLVNHKMIILLSLFDHLFLSYFSFCTAFISIGNKMCP